MHDLTGTKLNLFAYIGLYADHTAEFRISFSDQIDSRMQLLVKGLEQCHMAAHIQILQYVCTTKYLQKTFSSHLVAETNDLKALTKKKKLSFDLHQVLTFTLSKKGFLLAS